MKQDGVESGLILTNTPPLIHKGFDDIERRLLLERARAFRLKGTGDSDSDSLIADLITALTDADERLASSTPDDEVEKAINEAVETAFDEQEDQVFEGKTAEEWCKVHNEHREATKNALQEAAAKLQKAESLAKHEGRSAQEWYEAAQLSEKRRLESGQTLSSDEEMKWRSFAAGLLGLSKEQEQGMSMFDMRVRLTDRYGRLTGSDQGDLAKEVEKLKTSLAALKSVKPCAIAFAMSQHVIDVWALAPPAREAVEKARLLLEV